ncbi:TPA: hypothetical protein EYP44_00100 [Candidatus Bathyarchaeota archaeon]|nr:hypothetical protein [Candidatus Bathyarchaeota archaeon]
MRPAGSPVKRKTNRQISRNARKVTTKLGGSRHAPNFPARKTVKPGRAIRPRPCGRIGSARGS